jgi:hypothetical protein
MTAFGDACIYVVGMHRSGTSAVAGLLSHLGLGTPAQEDQPRAQRMNERGFFESKSLCEFDNRLLEHLGGSWKAPPELAPGWSEDPSLEPYRSEARALFSATFGDRPIVWKDPRSVLVLPFWNSVIADPLVAVVVHRDPFEVASSLQVRNGLRLTHGFALWERYVRAAAANLVGMPTFALGYHSLLTNPDETCEELISFLAECAVKVDPTQKAESIEFLDASLRHERTETADRVDIPPSTQAVYEWAQSHRGSNFPWPAFDLGPEPQWIKDTLSASREFDLLTHRYAELNSARPMRLARKAYQLRDVAVARIRQLGIHPDKRTSGDVGTPA